MPTKTASKTTRKPAAKKPAAKKPAAKFTFIEVRVGKLPGKIQTIGLNGGRTVAHALEGAEIGSVEGFDIKVNGKAATLDTELKSGQVVILVKKIKGNA